ncbi:MAG: 4Fe-4S binding protein [Coriobacteriia bacterium]|nr:4Fe-4S binding protein [Coriobacteriia bacterium]
MCQFCVEHGEGKRWYLQAENYSADLASDLSRRQYMVDFISGFDTMRANAVTAGEILLKLPKPVARLTSSAVSKRMQKNHFGQPLPLEDVEQVFDLATSITAIPCVCRMHEPNRTADEVCILVTTTPMESVLLEGFKDYDNGPDLDDFHTLTKDEAMGLARACEERGLMHSIWTFHTPFTAAICNCNLSSGCMAMKMTATYGVKVMWRGETVVQLDEERCTHCGACARICPFSAIDAARGRVTVRTEDCWGCGICRTACRYEAMTLTDRRSVPSVATLW